MTLNIGELKLESLGFIAVLFLQATFTFTVSGFWPLKKLGWYRYWSAAISAIPLGHSLLSAQPDAVKVAAAVVGTLLGLVASSWIAEKSDRSGKLAWSLNSLVLVSMVACLSDMKGTTSFFCGMLVTALANMAIRACRKNTKESPNSQREVGFPVAIRPSNRHTPRPRGIFLGDGNGTGFGSTAQIPQSRLNWNPRNN